MTRTPPTRSPSASPPRERPVNRPESSTARNPQTQRSIPHEGAAASDSEDDLVPPPPMLARGQALRPPSSDTPAPAARRPSWSLPPSNSLPSGSRSAAAPDRSGAAVSLDTLTEALGDFSSNARQEGSVLPLAERLRRLAVDPARNVPRAVVKAVLDSHNKPDLLAQQLMPLCQGPDAMGSGRARSLMDSDDLGTARPVVGGIGAADRGPLALFTTFNEARTRLQNHAEPLSDDLRASTLAHLNDLESLPVTSVDARVLRAAYTAQGDGTKLLDSLLQLDR